MIVVELLSGFDIVLLFKHVTGLENLLVPGDLESNKACEEAAFNDIDVFDWIVLFKNEWIFTIRAGLESLTYTLKFFARNYFEIRSGYRFHEGHLLIKNTALLIFDHSKYVILVEAYSNGLVDCDSTVEPFACLILLIETKLAKDASIYDGADNCL